MKVPLGLGAYKRTYSGEPEVRLENRYAEVNPIDKDGVALLARPGTTQLATFGDGPVRRCFTKPGLFGGDLFVCSNSQSHPHVMLYRYTVTGTKTSIVGAMAGDGPPAFAWMKGIGYQFLFLADGLNFKYYPGGTPATGTLSLATVAPQLGGLLAFGRMTFGRKPSPVGIGVVAFSGISYSPPVSNFIQSQIFELGGQYYSWLSDVSGPAAGTSDNPWAALRGANDAESFANMANLLNYDGAAGVDFSSNLPGANTLVSATSNATELIVTALLDDSSGKTITTSMFAGSNLAWGASTLASDGVQEIHTIPMPDNDKALALASLSGFVLVSVANSQKFYWLRPGETTIDPLNFAEKESAPDNIQDMLTVGDVAFIMGAGSTESWYATGDPNAPFAPQQGRVYSRGVAQGTAVIVKDGVVLVSNDGIIYGLDGSGLKRLSDHGIEERIRRQFRREQGLTP